MISANGISLRYGKRTLFSDVNINFSPGNCYGLIGANGSGKSTFLKILSGEIDSTKGDIAVSPGERISVLEQDQFAFDEYTVLNTVIRGHKKLYDIMIERDDSCANENFSDEDGIHLANLEADFADLGGWSAELNAAKLLSDLGIPEEFHNLQMKQLEGGRKVRVLLAQALFDNPDILLLDEPTNHLDVETCMWLEEFLYNFENIVIVVSHDRHFLNKICTHIADIDYDKIQLYPGNFSFWLQSSQLALKQRNDYNKKTIKKRKELQVFIARFSANASKSKQATSRKRALEKLTLEDIKPSSRKSPYINFKVEKDAGNDLLSIKGLSKSVDGVAMFKDLSIKIERNDKIAFVGSQNLIKSTLFRVLMDETSADEGTFEWGAATSRAYFPKDNAKYFDLDLNVVEWLRQYTRASDDTSVRGFLGRMLFSGEESLKSVRVLSGGERVRCILARMMLVQGNVLILDEPTNHLDLESIASLNKGLEEFPGTILFSSHDHQLVQTVANRIIEITPHGFVDRVMTTYDEYLSNKSVKKQLQKIYS